MDELEQKPLISVIIPVFKAEKTLSRCLESILGQTLTNLEIILVEDGSPDQSGSLCDKYSETDSRITVVHKKNGGVSSARNTGLERAQGKYIMFCDSDDTVVPTWAEKMYKLIEENSVSLGVCLWSKAHDYMRCIGSSDNQLIDVKMKSEIWTLYKKMLASSVWNKIFIKKVIDEYHLRFDENIEYAEDTIFVLNYLQKCSYGYAVINEPLYIYYEENIGSLSKKYIENFWPCTKMYMEELRKTIEISGAEIPRDYYTHYIHCIASFVNNNGRKDNPHKFIKKFIEGVKVFHSRECKLAFKKGDFKDYHPIYAFVLKKRCYLLVYFIRRVMG